ncbi:MAG: tetratricopeptide repeat protein [Nitriliruptorales bacterium]
MTEALALFEALGDARGMAGVAETQAILAVGHGRIRDAVDPLERAARLLEDSGELFRVGMARGQRGLLLILLGRAEEALPDINRALELDRLFGNIEGELWAKAYHAWALVTMGRVEEAREEQEEVVAECRRLSHRSMISAALLGLGNVYEEAGEFARAEEAFRESVETATSPLISSWAAARLAGVLVKRGDLARADEHLRRALAEALPMTRPEAQLVRAELALAREEPGADQMAADALCAAEASGWLQTPARARLLSRVPFGTH